MCKISLIILKQDLRYEVKGQCENEGMRDKIPVDKIKYI